MKDEIIIEIGSNRLFYGFYESMYHNSDEFIDDENMIKDNLKDILSYDFDVEYDYTDEDWKRYKLNVCKCFRDVYMETIIYELPSEIVDDDDFLFEIVDDDNIICCSPLYYNYTTDKPYWNIKTNYHTLELIKKYTLNMEGCKEYLIDKFTSRDGFISFVKNDIDYWKQLDIKEYDEIYIIALLDMLLYLSDEDIMFNLNYDVYDKVCKYEYTNIYVYYQRNKYELYDFVKKMNININDILC